MKKARFPLIMTIINLLLAIPLIAEMGVDGLNYSFSYILLALIPTITYFIITILTLKFKDKKYTHIISTIISAILIGFFFIYIILLVFFFTIEEMEHPEKSLNNYSYYARGSNLFPKKLPKNIKNTKLIYSPGVLQAGTDYILYYIDENLKIEKFDSLYEKDAQWVGYHKDYKKNDGISGIGLYYSLVPIKNYNDFKIYVLWSSCYKKDSCNHGSYEVVAVNEDTKEVMYRNSDW